MMAKRKLDRMTRDAPAAYARLAGDVAREILLTIARENKRQPGGFTKTNLAELIGRDKGFITRSLSGARNLELRTIAAMMGAMGYVMNVEARPIHAPAEDRGNSVETSGVKPPSLIPPNTTHSAASLRQPSPNMFVQNTTSP